MTDTGPHFLRLPTGQGHRGLQGPPGKLGPPGNIGPPGVLGVKRQKGDRGDSSGKELSPAWCGLRGPKAWELKGWVAGDPSTAVPQGDAHASCAS